MCHSLHSHLLVQHHPAEDNTQYFHYINTQSYHQHSTKLDNCVWQTCMVISEIQKWAKCSTEQNNLLKKYTVWRWMAEMSVHWRQATSQICWLGMRYLPGCKIEVGPTQAPVELWQKGRGGVMIYRWQQWLSIRHRNRGGTLNLGSIKSNSGSIMPDLYVPLLVII